MSFKLETATSSYFKTIFLANKKQIGDLTGGNAFHYNYLLLIQGNKFSSIRRQNCFAMYPTKKQKECLLTFSHSHYPTENTNRVSLIKATALRWN